MRPLIVLVALAFTVAPLCAQPQPQSEADRLRDAVRSLTAQVRALEDQRVANQTKLAQTEREKAQANQATERVKSQLKEAQDKQQEMVEEFNQRLAERDQNLERWKSAFSQAADVAREKDAQRAKFEGEATEFKARTKSCEVKNARLMKISKEIVAGYRDLTLEDRFVINEPLVGIGRVGHQNKVQDFRNRVLDQDVAIPAQPEDQKPQGNKTGNTQAGAQAEQKKATSAPQTIDRNGSPQ